MKQKIAVVGVGKLGLCFALNLENVGFEVWGIETNKSHADSLRKKSFNSDEPQVNEMLQTASSFTVVDDIAHVVEQDIEDIFLMVVTITRRSNGWQKG